MISDLFGLLPKDDEDWSPSDVQYQPSPASQVNINTSSPTQTPRSNVVHSKRPNSFLDYVIDNLLLFRELFRESRERPRDTSYDSDYGD